MYNFLAMTSGHNFGPLGISFSLQNGFWVCVKTLSSKGSQNKGGCPFKPAPKREYPQRKAHTLVPLVLLKPTPKRVASTKHLASIDPSAGKTKKQVLWGPVGKKNKVAQKNNKVQRAGTK